MGIIILNLLVSVTYVIKLCELGLFELVERVCVSLLHLTQTHVADAVTHLSYIQQGWPQGLGR